MPYRRTGLRRRAAAAALHAPKKFVMSYKVMDVVPDLSGGNVGGWQKTMLSVRYADLPGAPELSGLYRQFAITGIQYQYKSLNISGSIVDDQPSLTMLFAEDKASTAPSSTNNLRTQDNCKVLRSTQNFKHYIKYPRPQLYQSDGAGNRLLTIQSAKQLQWFDTNSINCEQLPHLAAQFQIEDCPSGVVSKNKQGEIWAKVYLVMKEQATG